jgi:hypothetical protein
MARKSSQEGMESRGLSLQIPTPMDRIIPLDERKIAEWRSISRPRRTSKLFPFPLRMGMRLFYHPLNGLFERVLLREYRR